MLPPAALSVADRLIDTLMTIVDAVAARAIAALQTPATAPDQAKAAETLFFRLTTLITALIRLTAFGPRAPREAAPDTPSRTAPAQPTRSAPTITRPGWLLDALPDIAAALAADLGPLLADPAFATLLGAAPTLGRTLRPLLRALGLTAAAPLPPSPSPPPAVPPPHPRPTPRHQAPPPREPTPEPPRRNRLPHSASLHDQFVTLS